MNFQVLQNGTFLSRFEAESIDAAITHLREMALEKATLVGPLGYIVANVVNSQIERNDAEVWIRRANYFNRSVS